jgi:uncharacterized coiled-coil DUF342 family protein
VLCKKDDLVEELLKCREELDNLKADLDTWTNSLEELSEIEGAFGSAQSVENIRRNTSVRTGIGYE